MLPAQCHVVSRLLTVLETSDGHLSDVTRVRINSYRLVTFSCCIRACLFMMVDISLIFSSVSAYRV